MTEYKPQATPQARQLVVRESPVITSTLEWAVPIIGERLKVASEVVPSYFWQYNFHKNRVCSCYVFQQDPDSNCNACFGTGFLPGYIPEGYYSFITLDASDPGLILVNVRPSYTSGRSPHPLELLDTALSGYVESSFMPLGPNLGSFSNLFFSGTNQGLLFEFTVDGTSWHTIDTEYHDFLATANKVKFRCTLSRASLSDDLPYVQVLNVRTQVLDDPLVRLDVPKWVTNLSATDAGLIPILDTFGGFANKDVKVEQITMWVHRDSKRKFKTLSITPWMPAGIMTSWDLQMRLIQPDESLNRVV